MKTTIKARHGYTVRSGYISESGTFDGTERLARKWRDGDETILIAYDKTYNDHMDELEQNECYNVCEIFKTIKGNTFIWARDEEINEDYLIKVTK